MAKKSHFNINPDTLEMERVEHGFVYWLRRAGWYILGGICLGIVFFYIFFSFFPSPKERQLMSEKQSLEAQYELLSKRCESMQLVLADLQQRDDNLYRVILGAEPIPMSSRKGISLNADYYDNISRLANTQLAADLTRKVDLLEKQTYVQAKSYEEIIDLAKTRELRMENIPAIQPVLNKDLTRVASGYGVRIDPVYHIPKFHAGMDFTAPTGTEVYATGNGKVSFVGWRQGYGNTVIVDHGFGYETLYAHLFQALVHQGQTVKRSDIIALVGNSGKSTGPHLHYEVHLQGHPIDPRNYYFYDLDPEQYDRMVQLSNNYGDMMD